MVQVVETAETARLVMEFPSRAQKKWKMNGGISLAGPGHSRPCHKRHERMTGQGWCTRGSVPVLSCKAHNLPYWFDNVVWRLVWSPTGACSVSCWPKKVSRTSWEVREPTICLRRPTKSINVLLVSSQCRRFWFSLYVLFA